MESTHETDVSKHRVTRFWSGAKYPLCRLSNFARSCFTFEGVQYSSSEAAFQAQCFQEGFRKEFSSESNVGALTEAAFVSLGVPPAKAATKLKHWKAKNQVGILSKMKSTQMKSSKVNATRQPLSRDACEAVFKRILLEKYKADESARSALLATGDDFLLEFDRGASRKLRQGHITRWAGMVVDGRVVGHNQQGSLQMWARQQLRKMYATR